MTWGRWWHKHARIYFKPKPVEVAEKWTRKLSFFYYVFAWNALGFAIYQIAKRSKKTLTPEELEGLSPTERMAKERGITSGTIFKVSGFRVEKLILPDKNGQD